MQLPFSVEQFFGVFRAYNTAVWPAQVLLVALALLALAVIWRHPTWTGAAVSAILATLWAWLALVYHVAFFASINPLAYAFAALAFVAALLFGWYGVVRREVEFRFAKDARTAIGLVLVVFALAVYPVWATLAGHGYPELPTFGLPCPTTIFTIGLLALSSGQRTRILLAVPILWSLVGSQAAFLLDVKPDLGLAVAGFIALGLFVTGRGLASTRVPSA